MSTLSNILHIGRKSLQVQQTAMQVLGHNIANVGTEGYSRRRVDLRTSLPGGIGQFNLGSGVDVQGLGRVRDSVLDRQIRESRSHVGYWDRRDQSLGRIEEIFNGLGDTNIDNNLQAFWNSWQDLANDPESEASRIAVLQKAQTLVSSVQRTRANLNTELNNANIEIAETVDRVNTITAQLAELNVDIRQAELNGNEAPDLRDNRDLLLEELAGLISITSEESSDGAVNVYTGGRVLVQGELNISLGVIRLPLDSVDKVVITYDSNRASIGFSDGHLKALIDLRDHDVIQGLTELDEFAGALAARVNEVHRTGYGLDNNSGQGFFSADSGDAGTLRIDPMILDDSRRIASAASPDAPGDNSVALAIAGIQHEKIMQDGTMTLDEFNRSISLRAGNNRAYAASQLEIEQAVEENLVNRRMSISGVSVDEEMTYMIEVQKAYEAAAQIVKTADEMINTLLGMRA